MIFLHAGWAGCQSRVDRESQQGALGVAAGCVGCHSRLGQESWQGGSGVMDGKVGRGNLSVILIEYKK